MAEQTDTLTCPSCGRSQFVHVRYEHMNKRSVGCTMCGAIWVELLMITKARFYSWVHQPYRNADGTFHKERYDAASSDGPAS